MKVDLTRKLSFRNVSIKPQISRIDSRKDVELEVKFPSFKIPSGVPVIAANLDSTGCMSMAKALYPYRMFVALHKYYKDKQLIDWFSTEESQLSFYTLGANQEDLDKFNRVKSNCSVPLVCIDIANAYLSKCRDFIRQFRYDNPDVVLMAGNVATPEGCMALIDSGVDIVKAGIANGALCATKYKAGVGYEQFSMILECAEITKKYNALLCSDGGVSGPSDICKALGGGANFVMCGSLFLGYEECETVWDHYAPNVMSQDGYYSFSKKRMLAYGMSSKVANDKYNGGLQSYRSAEGIEKWVECKGYVQELTEDIRGSLASCCTYTNSYRLQDLAENCYFTLTDT